MGGVAVLSVIQRSCGHGESVFSFQEGLSRGHRGKSASCHGTTLNRSRTEFDACSAIWTPKLPGRVEWRAVYHRHGFFVGEDGGKNQKTTHPIEVGVVWSTSHRLTSAWRSLYPNVRHRGGHWRRPLLSPLDTTQPDHYLSERPQGGFYRRPTQVWYHVRIPSFSGELCQGVFVGK